MQTGTDDEGFKNSEPFLEGLAEGEDLIEAIDRYLPEEDAYLEFDPIDEIPEPQTRSSEPSRKIRMSSGQRITLGLLVVVEIIIILYFAYIVLQDTGIL